MKYIKTFEEIRYRKDDWGDNQLTEDDLLELTKFEKEVDEFNSRSRWRQFYTGDFEKMHCFQFYKQFKTPVVFSDGTTIDIQSAIENSTHMSDDGGSIVDFMGWIESMQELDENGGMIYRLVYLTDENSLDRENPGLHWTTDRNVIDDFYYDYFNMYYDELAKDKDPYIIKAKIPPKLVKFNNLDRAREQEVTILEKDKDKIEIISVKRK